MLAPWPIGDKRTCRSDLCNNAVRTGKFPRCLELLPGECVEVFLVSGSPEERKKYVDNILGNQKCRIVLCSMQYSHEVHKTLNYFIRKDFSLYIQWLNPGHNDECKIRNEDKLGLVDEIISTRSVFSVRDGKIDASGRVQEMREFIYGWAKYRDLLFACE